MSDVGWVAVAACFVVGLVIPGGCLLRLALRKSDTVRITERGK